ncbi:SpoIID/LytB domain-containing protein [Bdellovibrio bacteriovorus]|uniref:SpoIID/LytB domain-containing protein n=1 Tax=Bdellovibrio TaxID=958 RepID=UPI0035A94D4C
MKLIWASLCFIFVYVSFLSEAQSSLIEGNEIVRVRLMTTPQKVQISGLGLRFQNLNKPFKPVAIPQNGRAEVRLMEKEGKKIWALRVNNKDPEHLFAEKFLLIQGENLRFGAQSLPSRVLLNMNANKKVDVVGVMPLDDYVVGVLASEMPLSWPLETLKAQAVAARSYALAVMEERKDKPYHLESSILDQVFRHVLDEDENDPLIKKAVQAVRETQGVKLYASNDKVLKAFFHSDCGGKTTSPKNVWNYGVNAGTTVDSSCPTNPRAHWKLTLTKEELSRRLQVTDISGIDLIRIPSENRVKSVRLALNESSEKVMSVNDFRQMLGFQDLRSALFEVKKLGGNFLFQGQGFGHGVGLCQWGSRALGKSGHNYKQILTHYYPLARLK